MNLVNQFFSKISYKKNILTYLTTIIIILSNLSYSKIKGISRTLLSIQSYEITLKIKSTGNQNIISSSYNDCPDYIYIEGNQINLTDSNNCKNIYLSNSSSTIKLVWDSISNNMDYMFKNLDNLLEVDLSKYDTSSVTSMKQLFFSCKSLISVNLSGLNTSLVTDITEIFSNCTSLTEIDLSSFNTSKVTSMVKSFLGCKNLISVNLSSFDTSKVTDMNYMFAVCENLIS